MAGSGRALHFSDEFVISCGTVTIDFDRSKVLLIRSRKNNECYLPKGRKDIAESLEAAAVRETHEETGYPVNLRPTNAPTKHTIPRLKRDAIIETSTAHTEPIAIQQRPVRGGLKVIFWYVGEADSTQTPDQDTQDENEDYETAWVSFDEMDSTLTFEDDKMICRRGIEIVLASQKPSDSGI